MSENHKHNNQEQKPNDKDPASNHQHHPVDGPTQPVLDPNDDIAPGNHTEGHADMDHSGHGSVDKSATKQHGTGEKHTDHTGHEQMFRIKFWVSLVLSSPVLL